MSRAKQATAEDQGSGIGSWFSSVVQSAKQKSTEAVSFLKSDLVEFRQETTRILADCTTAVQGSIKSNAGNGELSSEGGGRLQQGVSRLWGDISGLMGTEPSEAKSAAPEPTLDRFSSQVRAIQCDAQTYNSPPSGSAERFDMWRASCELDQRKPEISELLVQRPEVRALYTRLVPTQVSHADFWHRYFYKLHQLEQDEARRQMLVKRAELAQQNNDSDDDWGDIAGTSPIAASALHEDNLPNPLPTNIECLRDTKEDEDRVSKEKASDCVESQSEATSCSPVEKESDSQLSAGSVVKRAAAENDSSSNAENTAGGKESTSKGTELTNKLSNEEEISKVESDDLDDDWEAELDIEISEEDMKLAEKAVEKVASGEAEDDWESWE